MKITPEYEDRIANMTFASIYPNYIKKIEKKGRTQDELQQIIEWLTGYNTVKVQEMVDSKATFRVFFESSDLNPNANLIKGVICGHRIEEIEFPITRQVRYLDKLVDELAKGKRIETILRKEK